MERQHSDVIGCFIWGLQETLQRRTNGTSWILTTETTLWRTTETLLGVLFETCLRRRGDVLMGLGCYVLLRRRGDVSLRCLDDVPSRLCKVFIWDETATFLGCKERHHYDFATTSSCRMWISLVIIILNL